MTNVFDYVSWRGDLPFTLDPMNEIDALIFANLSYLPFVGRVLEAPRTPCTLKDVADDYLAQEDPYKDARQRGDVELLEAVSKAERYANLQLVGYVSHLVPEEDTQFAAVTFLLDDGSIVVTFRGTDKTLTGWKEDLDMSYRQTIPSQRLALEYLQKLYQEFSSPIYICGHSKGGNLAIFAGSRCPQTVRKSIAAVYNLDGPGFTDYFLDDPGYTELIPKIRTFVPQSSVVGVLMDRKENALIVHSSNALGIFQHDTYSWEVKGKKLVTLEQMTADSIFLKETVDSWLENMDQAERQQFVSAFFRTLSAGDVEKIPDIFRPKNLLNYLKHLGENDEDRNLLLSVFQNLVGEARRNYWEEEKAEILQNID